LDVIGAHHERPVVTERGGVDDPNQFIGAREHAAAGTTGTHRHVKLPEAIRVWSHLASNFERDSSPLIDELPASGKPAN